MATFHDFATQSLAGEPLELSKFKGKVCLVVNVASRCGLTPQYEGLQKLHDTYHERGLEVLGFPCNQFAGQEPGTPEQIQQFCSTQYSVTFPLLAKLDVNGAARDPIYGFLTSQQTAPEGPGDISWNFAKFLVGKDGQVLARFGPRTAPSDPALVAAIERAL